MMRPRVPPALIAAPLVLAAALFSALAAGEVDDVALRESIVQEIIALNDVILGDPSAIGPRSRRGDAYFAAGEIVWALEDFEAMTRLDPALAASHWRRGIACFYAGRYEDAARQFEVYHTFDDVDRENGIWRFFSQAKARGIDEARRGLLRYKKDDREPFGDLYRMFAGDATAAQVLERIAGAAIEPAERDKRLFYAHLYIGLAAAIEDRNEAAREQLRAAVAIDWPREAGYGPRWMWHVGRVHLALLDAASHPAPARPERAKKVAAIVTEYRHNSHADVIVSRLLQTDTLDGKGRTSALELASLYTDQVPENDTSRALAAAHGVPIHDTIAAALTLGTGRLAVDGVLLVAEHGNYSRSETGNTRYPKRRFFDEIAAVFRDSGRAAPIFCDKHLADNMADARHLFDEARALGAPLLAGSSLPLAWRRPAADVAAGAALEEIVVLTFGSTDHYGFHALEIAQCLAEQRRGGETGIRAVRCLSGDAVWKALDDGTADAALVDAALSRQPGSAPARADLPGRVAAPLLFLIEHADGLRVRVLELNGAIGAWTAAWRTRGAGDGDGDGEGEGAGAGERDAADNVAAAQFWTQEGRPAMHFTLLLHGIEDLVLTGAPPWPAERTLLTSGALDALLRSRLEGGRLLETPDLAVTYRTAWRWRQPPPPAPARAWAER